MHVLLIIMLAPLALCFGCFLVRIWPVVLLLFLAFVGWFFFSWARETEENRRQAAIINFQREMAYPYDHLTFSHPGSNISDQDHAVMDALNNNKQ